MKLHRRRLLLGAASLAVAGRFSDASAQPKTPIISVSTRTLEVKSRAAKVYSVMNAQGGVGLMAREGDRFTGNLLNDTSEPLIMHWHGQVFAAADQERSIPDGGTLAPVAMDHHDFALTTGTHWMHSHQLSEQQLLAAPMIARERDAGDAQEIVLMLHDFAYRPPTEILAELGSSNTHRNHGASPGRKSAPMGHGSMPGTGLSTGGAIMPVNANDVAYDAYLANDRTLDDPEIVKVDKGGKVRLRIINGATATAFFIDTSRFDAHVIAADGSPCQPIRGRNFALAQGQRLDLSFGVPSEGGAFPIFAQVEADRKRTGIVLATSGAKISIMENMAEAASADMALELDNMLRAVKPLSARKADRSYQLILGEEAGYRSTIKGKVHSEHTPIEANSGESVEITFMNPTSMMHPPHPHGHHFQVVGTGSRRFSGPIRDTVVVPPHAPVVIAFDANLPGDWNLHCHHLYHTAAGMMTHLKVS